MGSFPRDPQPEDCEMKVRSSLTKWGLLLLLALVAPLVCAAVDAGYEAAKRPSGESNDQCSSEHHNLADSWGFMISTCECVSYAAYRLNLNNVRRNNVLFGNDAWGTHFGYAYQWNGAATATGIREDQYPRGSTNSGCFFFSGGFLIG